MTDDKDGDHNDTDDADPEFIRAPLLRVDMPFSLADECIRLADRLMQAEAAIRYSPHLAPTLLAGLARLHGEPAAELSRRLQWAQNGRTYVDFDMEAEEEDEEQER